MNETAIPLPEHCRTIRDGMRSLVSNLQLPERFRQPDAVKLPVDFDVNSYFDYLMHLSVADAWCLDWVYFSDELGGRPLVYARLKDQAPFPTYSDYLWSIRERQTHERSYSALPHAHDYMRVIRADDTPESYLEFSTLAVLGDQFHLDWHGCYHDPLIVCQGDDIQPDMNGLGGLRLALPEDVLLAAKNIELSPTVSMGDATASVRIMLFTKWGGFTEFRHEHSRSFPHSLVDITSTSLVEYDCGIRF